MQRLTFDTIVIGSGLAGLTAAYYASRKGKVALLTKSEISTSNSFYAQGGIAGVMDPDDSTLLHSQDTLVAGRGICEKKSVDLLVEEGQSRILELIEMGMQFDRQNGELVLGLEGGHSKRRILHAGGDATGKGITSFMIKQVTAQTAVEIIDHTAAIRLLTDNGQFRGLQAINLHSGENFIFDAPSCILATGGLSRLYTRTTNPHTATGDGLAMAYQAGACLEDMEFIQFHPTATAIPGQETFLISEAVRGEGAYLLNAQKERFMPAIHPLAELAPRDIVAYSIFREMQKQQSSHVWLSLKHMDARKVRQRFSTIAAHLKQAGYDLAKDLIPVAPAAHYMVGGIKTDMNGETNIKGLFACGEVASTGVMGANRLASNSLLECLVFGKRAGEKAISATFQPPIDVHLAKISCAKNEWNKLFPEFKNSVAEIMTRHVGIIRNAKGLEEAKEALKKLTPRITTRATDYSHIKAMEALTIGRCIIDSALLRCESRGGHIREDFPKEDSNFRQHIIQQINCPTIYTPVHDDE